MISKKLLEFQQKNITIEKDGTNPHFKNRYATLNEVLSKVKEPLNALKVVVIQIPQETGLRTVLIDTEDESRTESFTPFVGATDMQKLGGAITYARRYSLVTMLGLEDEDDDGEAATASSVKRGKASADDLDF